jgi:hypothetical protein
LVACRRAENVLSLFRDAPICQGTARAAKVTRGLWTKTASGTSSTSTWTPSIAILNRAFEDVLSSLGLVDCNDPLTEIVARTIIDLAERGLRDPDKISEIALKQLRS